MIITQLQKYRQIIWAVVITLLLTIPLFVLVTYILINNSLQQDYDFTKYSHQEKQNYCVDEEYLNSLDSYHLSKNNLCHGSELIDSNLVDKRNIEDSGSYSTSIWNKFEYNGLTYIFTEKNKHVGGCGSSEQKVYTFDPDKGTFNVKNTLWGGDYCGYHPLSPDRTRIAIVPNMHHEIKVAIYNLINDEKRFIYSIGKGETIIDSIDTSPMGRETHTIEWINEDDLGRADLKIVVMEYDFGELDYGDYGGDQTVKNKGKIIKEIIVPKEEIWK